MSATTSTTATPAPTITDNISTPTSSTQTTNPEVPLNTEAVMTWPEGTLTCNDLEGNVPTGIDDSGLLPDGLLTYYWGDGMQHTLQVLNDATCTSESDAWAFVIRQNIDVIRDQPSQRCALIETIRSGTPGSAATLLEALAAETDPCS